MPTILPLVDNNTFSNPIFGVDEAIKHVLREIGS